MKIPILQFKDILLTSMQAGLTDEDALDFQNDLLRTTSRTEAQGVIIDITTLDIVDSFMGQVLTDTAAMAGTLGAKVVLCGMQPSVALTLIEMGRELTGVETVLNLDQAVEKMHRDIRERGNLGEREPD